MRPLWPIEQAVLKLTALQYAGSAEVLGCQIETVQVARFRASGAGFFSYLTIASHAPRLPREPLFDGVRGKVLGVKDGMDFTVLMRDGCLSLIVGHCNGGGTTAGIDFSRAVFALMPWHTKA